MLADDRKELGPAEIQTRKSFVVSKQKRWKKTLSRFLFGRQNVLKILNGDRTLFDTPSQFFKRIGLEHKESPFTEI